MDDLQKNRIERFINDPVTSQAIHNFLLKSFTRKRKERDTNFLAACYLAIELLDEAWKDLEAYKAQVEDSKSVSRVSGL